MNNSENDDRLVDEAVRAHGERIYQSFQEINRTFQRHPRFRELCTIIEDITACNKQDYFLWDEPEKREQLWEKWRQLKQAKNEILEEMTKDGVYHDIDSGPVYE